MEYGDEETFASVTWERAHEAESPESKAVPAEPAEATEEAAAAAAATAPQPSTSTASSSDGFALSLEVREPVKELEGSKDSFVSYAVTGSTDLAHFSNKTFSSRRRFQDFVFLREHLTKDYPACVVPPLPGKHRMEYITGGRFSPEFVEKRRIDLDRFLQRIARHPTLARASLTQAFLESTEWNTRMHQHAHTPASPTDDGPTSLLDNVTDTLLNAFAKVRKPDERFVEIVEELDKFEEALSGVDRIEARTRSRTSDLSNDYDSLANSVQGLAYLESGITEPLSRFEQSLTSFSNTLAHSTSITIDPFLYHLSALLAYSHAFRSVLKLRDQKQLDFEELSAYLSNTTNERDRLAAGLAASPGLGSYFKSKVDQLRGADAEFGRESRIVKLDAKIKELQDAVATAHEICESFNTQVLKEHVVFQKAKKAEMKQLLTNFADGQIAFYEKAMESFEACVPALEKIKSG